MTWEARRVSRAESEQPKRSPKIVALGIIAACCTQFSACGNLLDKPKEWINLEKDPREPAALVDLGSDKLNVKSVWSNSIGRSKKAYHEIRPYVAGDRVYVTGAGSRVEAWQMGDGKRIWSVDIQEPVSGGVNGGEGMLAVGTESGLVIALDGADGTERWRAGLSSEVLALSEVKHGVIVARTNDSAVHALDIGNGALAWRASRSSPPLTLRGVSQPKVVGSAVLVGYDDGKLVALSLLDGDELWKAAVSIPSGRSELERMADVDGDIGYRDDVVYAANFNGRAVAVDMVTGRMRWARDLSSHSGLSVDESRVYVVDEDDSIWALDRTSGATLWRQDKLLYRSLTAPGSMGDYIVVGDFKGYLHWLSKKDGKLAGRYKAAGVAIESTPVIIDHRAYVLAQNGSLTVLQYP